MGWKLSALLAMTFASPAAAQGFERFRTDIGLRAYTDSILEANFEKDRNLVRAETGWLPTATYKVMSGERFSIFHGAEFVLEDETIYFLIGTKFDDLALRAHKRANHSLETFTREIESMSVHELVHAAMYAAIKENNCDWWKTVRSNKDSYEKDLWKIITEGYADIVTEKITGRSMAHKNYEINDTLLTQPQGIHWDADRLYAVGLTFFRKLPIEPQTLNAVLSMKYTEQDYFALPQLRERIRERIKSGKQQQCQQP